MLTYWKVVLVYCWDRVVTKTSYKFETKEDAEEFYQRNKNLDEFVDKFLYELKKPEKVVIEFTDKTKILTNRRKQR